MLSTLVITFIIFIVGLSEKSVGQVQGSESPIYFLLGLYVRATVEPVCLECFLELIIIIVH